MITITLERPHRSFGAMLDGDIRSRQVRCVLVGDQVGYATGQVIGVNGGRNT